MRIAGKVVGKEVRGYREAAASLILAAEEPNSIFRSYVNEGGLLDYFPIT